MNTDYIAYPQHRLEKRIPFSKVNAAPNHLANVTILRQCAILWVASLTHFVLWVYFKNV